jgi:hypothetical protein
MTHDDRIATTAPAARRARRSLALVVMAVVVALLAGCTATAGGSGVGAGATRASTVTPTTGVPPTRRSPEAAPPTAGPTLSTRRKPEITEPTIQGQQLLRLRGTIVDAVESGCVVLRADDGGTWLLLGIRGRPVPSGVVQVTGYAVTGLATTCQQGRPLRVVSMLAP